jgi:2-polyprenyl-6-methoxyphenol hydroxylase-like FAD-dependent oxidoreductase
MRRVAIVGSGIAGLLAAHGFRRAGFAVSLFSDRTGADWLERSRPTGTAGRFDSSLSYDRELGLAHWDAEAPGFDGVSLVFCAKPGNRLVSLTGLFGRPALAIDVRLLSARWMRDLEERGGRVIIESVTVERLDQIAAEHELTVVAAGRKELSALFARNPERSVYDAPQRNLCMLVTRNAPLQFDRVPFLPVRFNLFAGIGEAFWVPYFHKDHGRCWNMLFEAKPGGPMDRFQAVKNGEEALAIGKQVIRDLIPWETEWSKDMTLADPNGWLIGGVAPTVREPVGRLPSGRVVTPLGDTAMSLDPIGGQGANNGTKMARHLVAAASARGARPFDEAWMRDTFESYWADQGRHIVRFNNALLEPITAAGKVVLMSQYGSDGKTDSVAQRLANQFCANFDDPRLVTDVLIDKQRAKQLVMEVGGRHPWSMMSGGLGVMKAQARQLFGLRPGHPSHG